MTTPTLPRLRFSLRTLFVIVTVCCIGIAWLTHQIGIVKHRQNLLRPLRNGHATIFTDKLASDLGFFTKGRRPKWANAECEISWLRQWLGDETVYLIQDHDVAKELPLQELQLAFPGTTIWEK